MAKNSFRRQAVKFEISGFDTLKDVLEQLGAEHGDSVERRLSRSALSAGMTKTAKAITAAAPKKSRIKKSVGKRFRKNRTTGRHEAVVGLNVGKKNGIAPHAVWFVLGTQQRKTKAGDDRGTMPAKPFVAQAVSSAMFEIEDAMLASVRKRLPIEIQRARARAQKAAGNG